MAANKGLSRRMGVKERHLMLSVLKLLGALEKESWLCIPALPLGSYVALDRLLIFYESQLLIQWR